MAKQHYNPNLFTKKNKEDWETITSNLKRYFNPPEEEDEELVKHNEIVNAVIDRIFFQMNYYTATITPEILEDIREEMLL